MSSIWTATRRASARSAVGPAASWHLLGGGTLAVGGDIRPPPSSATSATPAGRATARAAAWSRPARSRISGHGQLQRQHDGRRRHVGRYEQRGDRRRRQPVRRQRPDGVWRRGPGGGELHPPALESPRLGGGPRTGHVGTDDERSRRRISRSGGAGGRRGTDAAPAWPACGPRKFSTVRDVCRRNELGRRQRLSIATVRSMAVHRRTAWSRACWLPITSLDSSPSLWGFFMASFAFCRTSTR